MSDIKDRKLEVIVFTDPYCSWCWATEPMILAMQEKYRDQLHFSYVFGGLIKNMDKFYDATNEIRTAEHVVPHWKMVSERSGQPIDEQLWVDLAKVRDFSSWPANVAAKAAFLQGEEVGTRYLRRLRIAAETERKIISFPDVYERLAVEVDGLDLERLRTDVADGTARLAFEKDLAFCAEWETYGFPTMLFYRHGADIAHLTKKNAVYLGGHRTMETYDTVVRTIAPDARTFEPRDERTLLATYGPMTERELGQVHGRDKDAELEVMLGLEADGKVFRSPRVRGNVWSLEPIEGDFTEGTVA